MTTTPKSPTTPIDWRLYVDGELVAASTLESARATALARGGFLWVGLVDPDQHQVDRVAALFDLHPLAVEDATHAHQRPKIDLYDDMLFATLKCVRYYPRNAASDADQIVETGEVMAFLGDTYIVTVRHGDFMSLDQIDLQLRRNPEFLSHGPSAVFHAIIDWVVDSYLQVAGWLEDDVDALELEMFGPGEGNIERIYTVKREVMELRRAVAPLAAPLAMLSYRPSPLIDPAVRPYFRDAEDHLAKARDLISGHEELLAALVQVTLAQLSVMDNRDMRKLAAWAAIIAMPTMIAGVYGMNFQYMPELAMRWGYGWALGLMAGAALMLFRGFKRNGWL